MKKVPQKLIEFINNYQVFIIASHKEPDGDSIGSSLALSSFFNRIGKKTHLVSVGPFDRPDIKQYESLFLNSISKLKIDNSNTAVIVLDCSNLDRVGDLANELKSFPTAIIDHHDTNTSNNEQDYINSKSPATTLLVQNLIETMDTGLTKEEASYLLFGLCTDTGFFRHLDETQSKTFEFTSRLVKAGASPKQTFFSMNGGKTFNSRLLLSRILSRMLSFYNGKLIISYETLEDSEELGNESRDSNILYQLIQSIEGVEAVVIVRQESPTHCSVGFRSNERVDVSLIASSFGGGGHKQASGLYIEGIIDNLIPKFVSAFEPYF